MAGTDPTAEAGKTIKSSAHAGSLADAKLSVKADVTKLGQVQSAVDKINTSLDRMKRLMSDISRQSAQMQNSLGAVFGAGAGGAGGFLPAGFSAMRPAAGTAAPAAPPSGGGGGKGGFLTGTGGAFYATQYLGQSLASGANLIDNRANDNMAYALPADRLSLVFQQMTGMSQSQVATQLRQPLTNYRLGQGGINSLLSNQATYGINAAQQAPGYAALRAISGYSLSSQDLVGIQNQLTSPQVANRLFNLTGGFNFNGPNGSTKDLFTGIQQLANLQGLNNPSILKGAFEQGSRSRANLSNLGIDSTTQDLILQYAKDNQTYKAKGGKSNYDPNNKAAAKLMGIDNNYATQSAETDRVQTARDESMYRDQAHAYAALEKSNQQLIRTLQSVEHTFKSVISARTATRPWQKAAGGILKGIGAGLSLVAPEIGIPAYLIGSAIGDAPVNGSGGGGGAPATTVGGSSSDANDGNITVPFGYSGQRKSLKDVKNSPTFSQMQTPIKDRLLRAFRDHPSLGIGGGFRSHAEQQTLFLSRHHEDPNGDISWNGKKWTLNPGQAAAAPPGMSFHETGQAADLVGDLGWLQQNASKYGLKTFANVNNEPWHVQPVETSNSFSGSSAGDSGTGSTSSGTTSTTESAGGASMWTNSVANYSGMSIQDILDTVNAQRPRGSTSSFSKAGTSFTKSGSSSAAPTGTTSSAAATVAANGALSMAQVAQLAYDAGFRGEDIARIVAIGYRETGLRPNTHVVNTKTKDDSYGLFGLNMLPNALGPFLRSKGYAGPDLLNPATSLRAAHDVFTKDGWGPWTGYRAGIGWDTVPLAKAEQAVNTAGLMNKGDAPFSGGGSAGSMSNVFHSTDSRTITIPITFNVTGAPSTLDIQGLARQVKSIIADEVEMTGMRTA